MTARVWEPLPQLETGTPAWHAARQDSVGASEVAAVLGLSPWQTPLQVYEAKHGKPNEIDADVAYFGHALEPVIAGWVIRTHRAETGMLTGGFAARSLEWPFLTASLDRIASHPDGLPIGVELKTSSAFAKDAWADGVPVQYQAQVQAQMAVFGTPYGFLAVLHGGNQPAFHRIERDDEFIDQVLIPGVAEFWFEHVITHIPPEPTTTAEAIRVWPGNPDETVEATDELLRLWADLGAATAVEKDAHTEAESIRLEIEKRMGNASTLTHAGTPLVTWKPRAGSRRLDTAALRRDHSDLADAYTVQGDATRVFLRKAAKEVAA